MLLAIGNDGQFARFCHAVDKPEWSADPRFATMGGRNTNRGELIPAMETVTRTRTTAAWIKLLEDKAVPCGPINDIGQAFADEQVKARGLEVKQPVVGVFAANNAIKNISSVASPLRLTATPPVLLRAPPALGEHTDEVLREMGLSAEAIKALRVSGVV
jgi:crotonobetainyl-CoA:carnitine CoA-transferase CaiB-like acyl-CoA transferase